MFSLAKSATFVFEDGVVGKHRRTDGALTARWEADDLKYEVVKPRWNAGPNWRGRGLHGWTCLLRPPGECWLVPQHDLRLSAGVLLKTLEPRIVIPTHIGKILLIEWEQKEMSLAVRLESFFEGLWAVRRKFERELQQGRREATTADERVANLRKCRERMAAYSDRVVVEHMAVLPVRWKARVVGKFGDAHSHRTRTVVRLTTPDGCAVDGHRETNVAVIDTAGYCILVHVTERGTVEMECKSLPIGPLHDISPSGSSGRCCSKVFGQLPPAGVLRGALHRIRYVRDPIAGTDSIQTSEVIGIRRNMVPVQHDGTCGTTSDCRWLVFSSSKWMDGAVYDTELDKMAHLQMCSKPTRVAETSDGLWVWGSGDPWGVLPWTTLFAKDVLLSLPYQDVTAIDLPPDELVHRRVLDEAVEQEAFQRRGRVVTRRPHVHPGHYWVVAGYGPVPTRLRAPEHIYKQLASIRSIEAYRHFPYWGGCWPTFPWRVTELAEPLFRSSWVGAVDLRDSASVAELGLEHGVAWWSGALGFGKEGLVTSGEFVVKGRSLCVSTDWELLQVTVAPGRWLWKVGDQLGSLVTIWHESISEDEIPSYEWRDTCLLDVEKFERRMMELDSLAPLIPAELAAKVIEYSECVQGGFQHGAAMILMDKTIFPNTSSRRPWELQTVLLPPYCSRETQALPIPGGVMVGVNLNGRSSSMVGNRTVLRTSEKMIRVALSYS